MHLVKIRVYVFIFIFFLSEYDSWYNIMILDNNNKTEFFIMRINSQCSMDLLFSVLYSIDYIK